MKYLMFLFALACSSGSAEEIKTLYIGDHLVDCTGVAKQKCMLVRESEDGDWTYFYDQIEGFDYEEGYTYEIRVEILNVENPPADAPSLKYVLKELISKEPVKKDDPSDLDLIGSWRVIKITGLEDINIFPTFNFSEEESRVSGYAGCNNYFATYELNGKELKIGAAGATRKMCADMSVEDQFLKQLENIAHYRVIKSELHLFDVRDNLIYLAIAD